MIEVPSRGTSSLAIDREPVNAGFDENEDSEVPLLSRSHRTKGPAVIMMEARLTEVTRKQTSREGPVSVSTEVVPSSSFQGQGMSVDPIDIHPSSSVEIMPLVKALEQSLIAGLVGIELPTTRVRPTPVPSFSSSEKLDYSGDDDVDWNDVHSAADTSKYSHLAEEEMQVAAPRIKSSSRETSTVKGILSFLNHHSPLF